ncbi:MAG: hypothetical protein F6K30_11945 [Cyanothece sp. SIO2G6]|nr:hypothetical protein [Cyanothece sp. SIO2G6]
MDQLLDSTANADVALETESADGTDQPTDQPVVPNLFLLETAQSIAAQSLASEGNSLDSLDLVDTDLADNGRGDNGRGDDDSDNNPDQEDQTPATDDKPASRILLAVVSALTFGSIAGLVGYSIQAYEGDWYQVVAGGREGGMAEANTGDTAETPDANTTGGAEAGTDEGSETATDGATTDGATTDGAATDSVTTTTDGAITATEASPENGESAIAPDTPDPPADEFPVSPSEEDTAVEENDGTTDAAPVPAADIAVVTLQPPDAAIANCPAIVSSPTQTLTLSQIQIDPETAPVDGIYTVIGCLTNHADGRIVAATLDYEGRLDADDTAKGSMYFDAPDPGATVPFRTRLTLPNEADAIQVKGLIWNLAGEEVAQTLSLEFSLSLTE